MTVGLWLCVWFVASVQASLHQHQQLEAADQGSFEDFVANYYA